MPYNFVDNSFHTK